jgi:hypothetical protein
VQVAAVRGEIQDRIGDELAWPVIRDVAAPTGLEGLDPEGRQPPAVHQDVLRLPGAAERENVRMLEKQQLVGDLCRRPLADESFLETEPIRVGHRPEPTNLARTLEPAVAGDRDGDRDILGDACPHACASG